MTGYQSKKKAAQDKLAQPTQDAIMQSLKDLKRSVCDEVGKAAFAQPAQEPVCPDCKAGVLYECVACSSNNYPLQGAQEPVAWIWKDMREQDIVSLFEPRFNSIPLYTAPPQRPWVGLTEDELVQIGVATGLERAAVEMISNKLKEKNT
jgi:hypothetical protein